MKLQNNELVMFQDQLAVEEPLEIRCTYFKHQKMVTQNISVTMRTPGNDEELAAGFLFTEGIINHHNQIQSIKVPSYGENTVQVVLAQHTVPVLANVARNFYTTSSCGVCGKSSIDAIKMVSVFSHLNDEVKVPANVFYDLPDKLRMQQHIFQHTGGLHASALFDLEGKFRMLREDVGRHNALDKLIGAALLNQQLPLAQSILLLSGRASFELLQKADMAGIKIVAAVGAPSSLAVQLATACGITLIGFLKGERYNVYSGCQRIEMPV